MAPLGIRLPKPRLVLVDLDGTMVDSAPDLAYCLDATLGELDLPTRGQEAVRSWVGNGMERLLHRALTGALEGVADPVLYAKAWPIFAALYAVHTNRRTIVYEGVREGLDALIQLGFPLVCVTNKHTRFAVPLLEDLGLASCFRLLVAGDTLPYQKPDPRPLLYAMQHFQTPPEHCLMVGDSINDVVAARAAGCAIVCVGYGYNHGEDIRTAAPDAVVDSIMEVAHMLTPE